MSDPIYFHDPTYCLSRLRLLADAVKMLNHRPRKCLDYRTPHAVFQLAKGGAVAM